MKRLIIFAIILMFTLVGLLTFFPTVAEIINLGRDRDVFLNDKAYEKKYVHVDSLVYSTVSRSTFALYGYSKELNNYQTEILFGQVNKYENSNYENTKYYVWYNKNNPKYAYPAREKDEYFPVREKLLRRLTMPIITLVSALCAILSIKIASKRKIFTKK